MELDTVSLELVLRLFISALFGGLIGLERETLKRPAGLRTHILVSVGSALLMLVSIGLVAPFAGTPNTNLDPGRIAAQVVSGIGFLGAGTILRHGASIKGLTTAASLWVSAAIGLAVGGGFYLVAVVTTVIVMITLVVLRSLEHHILPGRAFEEINVVVEDVPGVIGRVTSLMGRRGVDIRSIEVEERVDSATMVLHLIVDLPDTVSMRALAGEVAVLDHVKKVE